ncbi:MAG: nitric oxide reductase activation protein [Clostridia bacterium]|nr:nitric oxide reductase activation protein [Clostridia bacterium]
MADVIDEHRMEIENRIKNLCCSVSGDYSLDIKPDVETYAKSKYIALYDAIKQGAFGKYFDSRQLSLYLMKKIYMSAKEKPLMELAQLCVDTAVYPLIAGERLGIDDIREKAFADILKYQEYIMDQNYFGQVKCTMIKQYLKLDQEQMSKENDDIWCAVHEIDKLQNAKDTEEIIEGIDRIYNQVFDQTFEEKHGDLGHVLSIEPLEIARASWQECVDDEQMEDIIKKYLANLDDDMMRLDINESRKKPFENENGIIDADDGGSDFLDKDREAVQKVAEYVELNYGKTCLTDLEKERQSRNLCKGIHSKCMLHFTEGILHAPVIKNNQYRFCQLQYEKNRMYYYNNHWIVKRNIAVLADTLTKALVLRQEEERCRSLSGTLIPARMWKLSRTDDAKLFDKKLRSDNTEFVVDILLDASGSQAKRQSQVAIQGYMISKALSKVGIAHRVSSYSTFWDHTIIHRFRDYDDGKDKNIRIFEYRASANNRDGLAIKAVCDTLSKRSEDNKILIVLSDGKPNDMGTNRPGTRKIKPYTGEEAIKDTAFEVRRTRALGVSVLGIFAGSEEDLPAEKKIYGKDFAYIRNISNFSRIVGTYLRRQLDK